MATRLVLHHSPQGYHMGGTTCFSLGSPTTASVMGQQRTQLGAVQGRALAAGPHSRSPRKRYQSGHSDAGYADSPPTALQTSPLRLWEFNPEGPRALQHFMGTTPMEMYKLFFGSQARCPDSSEDAGLSCNCPDAQVSSPVFGHAIRIFIIKSPLTELSLNRSG